MWTPGILPLCAAGNPALVSNVLLILNKLGKYPPYYTTLYCSNSEHDHSGLVVSSPLDPRWD